MSTTQSRGRARLEPLMVWSDDFVVGIEEIDSQHRRLFDLISAFYEGLDRKQGKQALGELLVGLIDYTRYHFQTEEALMRRAGYTAAGAHEQAHVGFVEKVTDMAERFQSGRLVLSVEATLFLREWLTTHILATDKQLGAWLKTKGPSR